MTFALFCKENHNLPQLGSRQALGVVSKQISVTACRCMTHANGSALYIMNIHGAEVPAHALQEAA